MELSKSRKLGGSKVLTNPADKPDSSSPLSRSESLRLLNTSHGNNGETGTDTLKKPKRTPSFTTRRRTASFRNKKKHPENLPPTEIEGYLERKHELQAGGKRAAVRSWKHYYVLLCGQLLCFFKDQEDFEMSKVGSSSPISVYLAKCEVATDYTKRKFVFRVKPTDGSEFLFAAESKESMDGWVKKINFHAGLDPKNQLDMMEQNNPGSGAADQVSCFPKFGYTCQHQCLVVAQTYIVFKNSRSCDTHPMHPLECYTSPLEVTVVICLGR